MSKALYSDVVKIIDTYQDFKKKLMKTYAQLLSSSFIP